MVSSSRRRGGQRGLRAGHWPAGHRDRRRECRGPAVWHDDPAADADGSLRQGDPLPAVRVHDWPKMAMRGVHDEFSYGQVSTMENFKDMIRFLAEFKMNTLIFYFEDTFRFKRYPKIGDGRGALTREQIDELEAFAKPLGVEIFPVFEMLGNQGALLMLDEVAAVCRVSRGPFVFGRRRGVWLS